ncbi:MAG: TIGR01244 family sulfur transferase [Gammaproteobacteria bacterium]|nr:TIGR01244 family sulfur transferase [Gammaproteobacteria bacterium]MDP2140254.1 TIGR01244 family sulfur transferase [Gammaproteobacteria bacterium]MDP2348129.1 TIGR01244 family sulfur transferase [Gammaproteobacteria bacterium]
MNLKTINEGFAVTEQIGVADVEALASQGVRSLICNRPDGEVADQPAYAEIERAALQHGMSIRNLPVVSSKIEDFHIRAFAEAYAELPRPLVAYCRSGTRSITLWALAQGAQGMPIEQIVAVATAAGYDLADTVRRIESSKPVAAATQHFSIVIVGAGSGGIAVAASLLKRKPDLQIAIIDKAQKHYYQPGWTMVGGGVFRNTDTERDTVSLIPRGVQWLQSAVQEFAPDNNRVVLDDGSAVSYDRLIVACGIKLNWAGVEGLTEALGRNGVTSNYRYDLAPYTWELVQGLKSGRAVFTQPPMPIKCAGAPQKALYLSGDYWYRTGALKNIDIQFYNAGAVLFGVKDYVPALMKYIERYKATLQFNHRLIKVDGEKKQAWFERTDADGQKSIVDTGFDMLHVCPPQQAPDVVRSSALADAAGWVDVDQETLRHKRYNNVWSVGDVMNAPNAKTMAAARKQAPVVAHNLLADMGVTHGVARYDGYGSCPLTVERGRIVLAEFGFGGKLLPSFPDWINKGTEPSRLAWMLKKDMLPPIYWHGMLKGHEWLASPNVKQE